MNADDILAVANAQQQPALQTDDTDMDSDLWPEIRRIIETRMSSQPRDLQREIGPSELGTSCVHCLAAKLAGWPERRQPAWLPFIGTCVHARFEQWFKDVEELVEVPDMDGLALQRRFTPEMRVTVGHLQGLHAGYDVQGSIDLYDRKTGSTIDWKIVGNTTLTKVKAHGPSQQYRVQASLYGIGLGSIDLYDRKTGSTIDWKIVGNTTLTKVKAHGPSQQYRVQASLYGIGLENRGEAVRYSRIYFLPKTKTSLADALPWQTQFDPKPGRWALARAQLLVNLMDCIEQAEGIDVRDSWIHSLPAAGPDGCFQCRSAVWPDQGMPEGFDDKEWTPIPDKWARLASVIEPEYQENQPK